MLFSDINEALVLAMKAKDEVKVSTLRMLVASIKNKQIDLGRELNDEEVTDVISKSAKQHKESIEAYKKGGRDDLAEKEKVELKVLEAYLPELMSEAEVEQVVVETIRELGAGGTGDTGRVIGAVMTKLKGKADGGMVSTIVRKNLS